MSNEAFEAFVKSKFIDFLVEHEMAEGTISNGLGSKATVKRDKHGFYKVIITNESTSRGSE